MLANVQWIGLMQEDLTIQVTKLKFETQFENVALFDFYHAYVR